ncbi:hypothetical protein OGM63_01025 [Plectonema radiosum NIES-515]|uniref:Uncharacterized protein n=1 Tax=Plectonema radiosum NIES-515 TaxID=2986073 RepID=A0ABT3ASN7_9CYAN|nr:hypothetical protein [Plectonema radiosum]MCV3212120.1 hypothetical protein [Plectonema radiosum NIES-515]
MEKLENVKSDRQQQKSPLSLIKKLLIARWRSLLILFIGVYLPGASLWVTCLRSMAT